MADPQLVARLPVGLETAETVVYKNAFDTKIEYNKFSQKKIIRVPKPKKLRMFHTSCSI